MVLPEVQWVELCSRTLQRIAVIDPQLDDAATVDAGRDVLTAGESGASRNHGRAHAVGTLHAVVAVAVPSCLDGFVVNGRGSSSERRFSG